MVEWRWVDEQGRAMTNWKSGPLPPMTEVSDDKGTMRVVTREEPQREEGRNGQEA